MKRISCLLLLTALTVSTGTGLAEPVGSGPPSAGLTADEILKKADDVLTSYENQTLTSTITVVDSDGTERMRQMKVWQKGDMRLIKFIEPADWKGTALLALDSKTNYIYLPSYKRVRKVAAHARNQSFQGMDFTQADMALIRFGTDYTPKLIEETDTHYVLELTPKPDSEAGYGKLILRVGKDRFGVEQIDYYDKSGKEKLKVEERTDFQLYEGKHYNASTLTVTSAKENHKTIMKNSDYAFDQDLPDDYFTTRNLNKPLR
jgi:outer membrane lipoprotein-sorting protein